MKRWLWRIAWGTSLFAFVVLATLAIKSYIQPDYVAWSRNADHHLESVRGRILYCRYADLIWDGPRPKRFQPSTDWNPALDKQAPVLPSRPRWTHESQRSWSIWGGKVWLEFSSESMMRLGSLGVTCHMYRLVVPYWMPLTLAAILPASQFLRWLAHRRRIRRGGCANCGYDLRATPDRCPECGHVPGGSGTVTA